jgi:hypothetical protein
MDHGGIELMHENLQASNSQSALKESAEFSPGRETESMSGNCDRMELIVKWARPRTDHMRLPLLSIERFQQGHQIALRPADGLNPMHVQNSRGHYLASG